MSERVTQEEADALFTAFVNEREAVCYRNNPLNILIIFIFCCTNSLTFIKHILSYFIL